MSKRRTQDGHYQQGAKRPQGGQSGYQQTHGTAGLPSMPASTASQPNYFAPPSLSRPHPEGHMPGQCTARPLATTGPVHVSTEESRASADAAAHERQRSSQWPAPFSEEDQYFRRPSQPQQATRMIGHSNASYAPTNMSPDRQAGHLGLRQHLQSTTPPPFGYYPNSFSIPASYNAGPSIPQGHATNQFHLTQQEPGSRGANNHGNVPTAQMYSSPQRGSQSPGISSESDRYLHADRRTATHTAAPPQAASSQFAQPQQATPTIYHSTVSYAPTVTNLSPDLQAGNLASRGRYRPLAPYVIPYSIPASYNAGPSMPSVHATNQIHSTQQQSGPRGANSHGNVPTAQMYLSQQHAAVQVMAPAVSQGFHPTRQNLQRLGYGSTQHTQTGNHSNFGGNPHNNA